MALYREEVARVTLRQVRNQFSPRLFNYLSRVKLRHGTVSCDVVVEKLPGAGCFGGQRRWFRCPRCAARTVVIGFAYDGPGCRACIGWRGRNRLRLGKGPVAAAPPPHIRNVTASDPNG